jgi:prepilin-type N-terminal cleavage/methylation domain-containing protein
MEWFRWIYHDWDPVFTEMRIIFRHSNRSLHPDDQKGFTLVELLTATAILSLLLMLMFQIVSEILQSTKVQNQQMESVTAARRALDVMSTDLQNAVVGENISILVPAQSGVGALLGMVCNRRGPNAPTLGRYLGVCYGFDSSIGVITRSYTPIPYGDPDLFTQLGSLMSLTTPPPVPGGSTTIASNILSVQVLAEITSSSAQPSPTPVKLPAMASPNWASNSTYNSFTVPPTYNAIVSPAREFAMGPPVLDNTTSAFEIWIASIDQHNYDLLQRTGSLTTLQAALSQVAAQQGPSSWRATVDAASIPSVVKSGIRILNKTIFLP